MLNSPVVEDLQALPVEFTGDGDGISPPLQWNGAPAGTKGYALIMDHVTPDGDRKWYWTVYDIPANASSLPKNVTDIGKLGTGFEGEIGYRATALQRPRCEDLCHQRCMPCPRRSMSLENPDAKNSSPR